MLVSWGTLAQINPKATQPTKNLYQNLQKKPRGIMLGHQDGLAYGLTPNGSRWIGESDRSDIKSVIGEHPAVAGWDLGHLELDSTRNIDDVPFALMKSRIIEHFRRGGINTLSWHARNPTDPTKTTWDKVDSTIQKTLRNRTYLSTYKKWLDKVAAFAKSLKDPLSGELVPIIFRPYHEHTGSWFWWGANYCTPEEYREFWRFTVDYLTKKKRVRNFLYAYSTDKFTSKEHYLERYPDNHYVDLIGFDIYHRNAPQTNEQFVKDTRQMVEWLQEIGTATAKPTAITETGLEQITEANWWTSILGPIVKESQLTYVLMWRNGRPDHFYAPYPGHRSEANFKQFVKEFNVQLEQKTASLNLYQK